MRSSFIRLTCLILLILVTGCGAGGVTPMPERTEPTTPAANTSAAETPSTENPSFSEPGTDSSTAGAEYPAPASGSGSPNYPAPQEEANLSGYPPPQQAVEQKAFQGEIVPFNLDKPLKVGMTEIRGTGPTGVPIVLADLTFEGEEMGSTVINDDGTFVFTVPPLEAQHRIGIKLGSLSDTDWNDSTFDDRGFFGPGAQLVPQDGLYYDTVLVEE